MNSTTDAKVQKYSKRKYPGNQYRRVRKAISRRLKYENRAGIPLPGRDPAIQNNKRPKRVLLNRWEKYKRIAVDLNDVHAIIAAIQKLEEDIECLRKDPAHYQPEISYHYKMSCRLEGAEKQLAELLEIKANIKEAQMGLLLPESVDKIKKAMVSGSA